MKLTGKTKEAFEKWLYENHRLYLKDILHMDFEEDILLNALIIEFFDSVGIYIGFVRYNISKGYFVWRIHYTSFFGESDTRKEATDKAIEKANEIFNLNK